VNLYSVAMAFSTPYHAHAMDSAMWADFDSDSHSDRMDYNMRRMVARQPGAVDGRCDTQTVELALDPELLATFCRRSRRRLRDVQASCQVSVKLDRTRGVLRVTGTEPSIQAVRRQLASLAGPRRNVPPAVWAELMRTRKMCNSDQATVARLQEASGCRIHIERSQQEVRLFGPGEAVAIADQLLAELATQCTEQAVRLPKDVALSSSALETLAHRCRITLRMEDGQIIVLGMAESVAEGAKQLTNYLADPTSFEPMSPEEALEYGNTSGDEAEKGGIVVWDAPGAEKPAMPQNGTHQSMRSPHSVNRTNSQGSGSNSASSGKNRSGRCCHSCGASRFCGSCGALTGLHKGQTHSWESTTAGGSDRSKPTTPDSPDTHPMGAQQWYQYMPQQMMSNGMGQAVNMGQAMNMGQAGMVPVCMVTPGPGGAMVPAGMVMVPASSLQDNGWMAQQQQDGSGSIWVPNQQGPQQGVPMSANRQLTPEGSLANLHETLLAYQRTQSARC